MTESPDDKFPELNDAVVGIEELSALFRDYRACATVDEILVKPGPGYVRTEARPTLEQAEEFLKARSVRGVQIRYQFNSSIWCDTLLPVADGIRLVRIRQSQADG